MTTDKLKRILWRIKEEEGNLNNITPATLRKAIMKECGTDPRTYSRHVDSLLRLGWLIVIKNQPLIGLRYKSTEKGDAI